MSVKQNIYYDFSGFQFLSPIKYHAHDCNATICDCQDIEQVASFKYLGVTLDEKMNWDIHINNLHNTIRSTVRTFYYLRNFCNTSLLRTLYFALINSKLQYGIICWGSAFKYLIDRLRVTQNFFIRIILKKNVRESSSPLYKELKLLPIQHLFIYKVLRVFYVRSGNKNIEYRHYGTRSTTQGIFKLPKVNKILFRRSLLYLGPKLFNQLPTDIKQLNSKKTFFQQAFKWLLEKDDVSQMSSVLI